MSVIQETDSNFQPVQQVLRRSLCAQFNIFLLFTVTIPHFKIIYRLFDEISFDQSIIFRIYKKSLLWGSLK